MRCLTNTVLSASFALCMMLSAEASPTMMVTTDELNAATNKVMTDTARAIDEAVYDITISRVTLIYNDGVLTFGSEDSFSSVLQSVDDGKHVEIVYTDGNLTNEFVFNRKVYESGQVVGLLFTHKSYVDAVLLKIKQDNSIVIVLDDPNNETLYSTITNTVAESVTASITTEVDQAFSEVLGSNWKTTYGGGVAGLIAAIAAALALLEKKKLDTSTVCDEWDSSTTYAKGANVVYEGKFYVSRADENTNHKPTDTEWWDVSTLFSSVDTSTDPAASGLLSNATLDKGIVKVGNTLTRYSLSTTSSVTMADRTTNVYDMTASVTLVFPAQVSGKMRDFLLVVNVASSATTTAITLPSDVTSVGDTLTLTADKQYLIAFTEIGKKTVDSVEKALFYVRAIQL